MISPDGTKGAIPRLVAKLRKSNAHVVYSEYLRSPGASSTIESCHNEGDELDARLARMAKRDNGVWFFSMADVVPCEDRSFDGLTWCTLRSKAAQPPRSGLPKSYQSIAKIKNDPAGSFNFSHLIFYELRLDRFHRLAFCLTDL